MAAAPAAAAEAKALFRALIREGRKFNNYNIREYVLRRARDGFRGEVPADKQAELLAQAAKELAVVKRQGVVYSLYGRGVKNVLELDAARPPASGAKPSSG